MMRNGACLHIWIIGILALNLVACGGGDSSSAQGLQTSAPVTVAPKAINLALASISEDGILKAQLDANEAQRLYQLSCRISYNPEAVRPIAAVQGTLVDSRAVFFSRTSEEGYIPVAFTYHPGEAIPAANGSIVQLDFEIIDPAANPALRIIDDPKFLLVRDASAAQLDYELGGAL